jgi:hypothetical protein
MTHVPYKGSAQQVQDMVGGHVLLGFTQLQSAIPHPGRQVDRARDNREGALAAARTFLRQ